jgi:integrase
MTQVGQHHVAADTTARQISYLIAFFGKDKLITEITGDDVTRLVAWRRGHRVMRGPKKAAADAPFISAFTVNDTTEQLKKLFTRAKIWGVHFEREPRWKDHWLAEPQEFVRELVGDEAERLDAETREDYRPFFAFARASGFRLQECFLRWREVDWEARQIRKKGKGGRLVTGPITSNIRSILWPLLGHHREFVFTYVATRTREGRIRGNRYPLTYSGVKSMWRRLRARAGPGVEDFRFHDFRHDLATKLLRETGNLKLVQRALNHADLKTTARYAHVLDHDVAEGLERLAESRENHGTILGLEAVCQNDKRPPLQGNPGAESRKKSRSAYPQKRESIEKNSECQTGPRVWGTRGRGFESRHSDHEKPNKDK